MESMNFSKVMSKAKTACKTAGHGISDHFVDVNKTIAMPKGAEKEIHDFMLNCFACYLIAQNGDPQKGDQIAWEYITNNRSVRTLDFMLKSFVLLQREKENNLRA